MPSWVADEDKWEKAKELARKQGKGSDYGYITGIYKKMGGRVKENEAVMKEQDDPARICGFIWFHGTDKQRKAFGKGTEGRGKDEKPPKAWWNDCVRTVAKREEFKHYFGYKAKLYKIYGDITKKGWQENFINPGDIKEDENKNKQMLRVSIIAEQDAVNLYERFAKETDNPKLKKIFESIAKEEKTHIGEFESMLKELDKEFQVELTKGEEEVNNL